MVTDRPDCEKLVKEEAYLKTRLAYVQQARHIVVHYTVLLCCMCCMCLVVYVRSWSRKRST